MTTVCRCDARVLAMLAMLAMLAVMAGCEPRDEPAGDASHPSEDTPAQIDASIGDAERIVNVYVRSDSVDETVFREFEKATGVTVVLDTYASPDVLETQLLAGGSGYDVVMATGAFLARDTSAGVFRKLEKSRLTHAGDVLPVVRERTPHFDPRRTRSVEFLWSTVGIGYDAAQVLQRMADAPVDSWRLIFDPAVLSRFADCGVHVLESADVLVQAALSYIGEDPGSQDPAVIARAEPVLAAIQPYIQRFESAGYGEALARGDICISVGHSTEIVGARERARRDGMHVPVDYVVPAEGAAIRFEQLAIPSDAFHPLNAYALTDYLLQPENLARITERNGVASVSRAAAALLREELANDAGLYPAAHVRRRLYVEPSYTAEARRAVNRAWVLVGPMRTHPRPVEESGD